MQINSNFSFFIKNEDIDEWFLVLEQSAGIKMKNFIALTQSLAPKSITKAQSTSLLVKNKLTTSLNAAKNSQQQQQPELFFEKRGWLIKKGKRRYFILQKTALYYFSDEQSEVCLLY